MKRKKPGKQKGSPKTGGRVAGTPNRNSLSVRLALDALNTNLVELIVADIALLEPRERLEHYARLMLYTYPKLKDIDAPDPRGLEAPPKEPDLPDDPEALRALANPK